ncbi:uncharacterized protein DUF998 [Homoserinimonas aerilata]|uniref:Uncharacterized protein DUF998 n=1 Tax=Homoserinimonas aerilata TaxID=1162970 RepID=A0A542YEP4_9MICO|nr:DUF998 domain-containing protein [Homoserinimonas aerilata]TQL46530.1 uncharacterized protein DUF998 [Homoserinimonas aerilata]
MAQSLRHPAPRSAISAESRALTSAIAAFVGGFVVALIAVGVRGADAPLFGAFSIGLITALSASGIAVVVFVVGYVLSMRSPVNSWRRSVWLPRFVLDVTGLSFTHAAIAFMAALAMFSLLQRAFEGLAFDAITSALTCGVVTALTAYVTFLSASAVSTYSLSQLLAVFVVSGSLTSMLTADEPHWWQSNFSALGVSTGFSGYAFNATVLIAGLVVITLADYVTTDLEELARRREQHVRWRSEMVRWLLVTIGVALIGVALVPVNLSEPVHNIFATGLVVVFFALMVGIRWFAPVMQPTFLVVTSIFIAVIGTATVLFWPVGYYNLTGFELVVSAVVFAWLIIFVRNIAAALHEATTPDALSTASRPEFRATTQL